MSSNCTLSSGSLFAPECGVEEADQPPLHIPTCSSPVSSISQLSTLLVGSLPSSAASSLTSPSSSAMMSRRSSSTGTSKSVHWDESPTLCVTHSATLYDRSPIICTGQDESLEIPSCKGATEGWIRCMERARAISHIDPEVTSSGKTIFPRAALSSSLESSSDTPRLDMIDFDEHTLKPDCASPLALRSRPIDDEAGLLDDKDSQSGLGIMPSLIQDDSSGSDSDELYMQHHGGDDGVFAMDRVRVRHASSDDDDDCCEGDEDAEDEEDAGKPGMPRFGMCGLGKWTRGELFGSLGDDCLAGF